MLKPLLALVFLAAGASASVSLDARASYPEGPLWHDGRLYVAEMGRDQISVFDGEAKRVFWRERGCGPTAITSYGEGFLVMCHLGRRLAVLDAEGRTRSIIAADVNGAPFLDPNDGAADSRGGVYVSDPGDFALGQAPHGSILHVAADGAVRRVARALSYPNGVYVDADERALYVSEHFAHRILRYPILPDASLGPRTVFARIDFAAPPFARRRNPYGERGPDGLERGPDGRLYVAIYGEGIVLALDREGRVRNWIETPMRYVTNIAFAPDGDAIIVGAHENLRPPFRGEVRRWSAASLRAAPPMQGRRR